MLAGCSKAGTAGSAPSGGDKAKSAAVKVGLVYSRSGPLAAYGKQYLDGFNAGLAYATHNTGKAAGHRIEVIEQDDTGDPAKAVAEAKTLIGKGTSIIAGTTDSGVALQLAPLAAQNHVLYIAGPAATDALTGLNAYTFRSGRQSYQDILTAGSLLGDSKGKKVTVLTQNSAFGQANVAAVKEVLGGQGAKVDSVLAPPSAGDLTPFAQQVKAKKPDLVFVAWAGASAPALWTALDQQGVVTSTKVVTGLAGTASYPLFGTAGSKINFLAHYFPGAAHTSVETAMLDGIKKAAWHPRPVQPGRLHRRADDRARHRGGQPHRRDRDGRRPGRLVVRGPQGRRADQGHRPRAAPADVHRQAERDRYGRRAGADQPAADGLRRPAAEVDGGLTGDPRTPAA